MRIRNNNVFVLLLAPILGVLVALYSRVGPLAIWVRLIRHTLTCSTQASQEVPRCFKRLSLAINPL
jgi:uncharacterized Tic20 family protein